jgi:uncharacterized protein (TIGR02284 family)
MAIASIDTLNSLLRGEMAAVETYQQALEKLRDTKARPELERMLGEHRDAVHTLREHIGDRGWEPDQSAGAWGAFAKAVEGTAKMFGARAALKALKEGEEHGVKQYQASLDDMLPAGSHAVVSTLLNQTQSHIAALDRLLAGMVDRIEAEDAHREVARGATLICAYDDADKCHEYHLEGAIPLSEFQDRVDAIPKNSELIFYCA